MIDNHDRVSARFAGTSRLTRPQLLLVIGPKLIRDRIMEGAFDDADFALDLFVRAAQDIPDQNSGDQKTDAQKRQEDR